MRKFWVKIVLAVTYAGFGSTGAEAMRRYSPEVPWDAEEEEHKENSHCLPHVLKKQKSKVIPPKILEGMASQKINLGTSHDVIQENYEKLKEAFPRQKSFLEGRQEVDKRYAQNYQYLQKKYMSQQGKDLGNLYTHAYQTLQHKETQSCNENAVMFKVLENSYKLDDCWESQELMNDLENVRKKRISLLKDTDEYVYPSASRKGS